MAKIEDVVGRYVHVELDGIVFITRKRAKESLWFVSIRPVRIADSGVISSEIAISQTTSESLRGIYLSMENRFPQKERTGGPKTTNLKVIGLCVSS